MPGLSYPEGKVNIEFYEKMIGTQIPRLALFLTCHMTVKLNLDLENLLVL